MPLSISWRTSPRGVRRRRESSSPSCSFELEMSTATVAALRQAGQREGAPPVTGAGPSFSHSSQALWLNNAGHNWLQLPSGTWGLDQLWVEGAR